MTPAQYIQFREILTVIIIGLGFIALIASMIFLAIIIELGPVLRDIRDELRGIRRGR